MSQRGYDFRFTLLLLGVLASDQAIAQFERAPEAPPEPSPGKTLESSSRPSLPRLLHFEAATYPVEARQAGLTADVVLRLTVDPVGLVIAAEVVAPVGNGFDEAAREAAMRFVFEPAKRDGVGVKARILYRYSFTLEQAPESAAHADLAETAAALALGEISGVLRVAGTDSPLVGAVVVVVTPSGAEWRQPTDKQGHFAIAKLEPGQYRIRVTSAGFLPIDVVEKIVSHEVTEVTYRLAPEAGSALEVTVQGERPAREVTRRTIERREIERIPGTSGDALRAIESLPGVARPPAFAGMLVVRGSYPQDTQVYVDGSMIPLVYHFGGLRSVLPTELLERIDFYPGNYGAKYGRGMGGLVDVGLRSPETRCKDLAGNFTEKRGCLHATAQLDLIEGRILLQGPLPIKGWSFVAGARRSWFDAWVGPVIRNFGATVSSLPVYYDYQFIVERKLSNDSRTSLRFFGSDDRFAAILDPLAQEPAFGGSVQFATTFLQAQFLHEQKLNANVSLSSLVTQGRTAVSFGVGTYKLSMLSHPFHFREELSIRLTRGAKLNTGLDFQIFPYEFSARSPEPPRPGQPSSGPFSSRPLLEASQSVTGLNQGFYADAELQPFERLRVVPGMRIDYGRETRQLDTSPRLTARFDLAQGGVDESGLPKRRTTIKTGVGYYYQAPQPYESNNVFGTLGLRSNRAVHYALGIEQELTQQVDVSVEGFYKDFDHLVAQGIPTDLTRFTNNGVGKSYGLETLIRYKPDTRFFGWLAYTLSRSERRDYEGGAPYLIPYDQTHNLTVLGSYRLGNGWEFGARFRIISGSLITQVRATPSLPSIFAADAGASVPLQGQPYTERLPLFHQLDLRLDKRWQIKNYRVSTYLDVYNVYNHPAVERFSYDYNFAHRVNLTGIPILPSVGVRGEI